MLTLAPFGSMLTPFASLLVPVGSLLLSSESFEFQFVLPGGLHGRTARSAARNNSEFSPRVGGTGRKASTILATVARGARSTAAE